MTTEDMAVRPEMAPQDEAAQPDHTAQETQAPERLFKDIGADDGPLQMESLCMACGRNGVSRFLLTRIPHFRDVVVAAFECAHCGARNSEVQSVGAIAERGVRQSCLVADAADLCRQVVVSEHASVLVEEVALEVPPSRGAGFLSTVEGVLGRMADDLSAGQDARRAADPGVAERIDGVVSFLRGVLSGARRATFVLDDPSGNSYIESLSGPRADARLKLVRYVQTGEQLAAMGFDPSHDSSAGMDAAKQDVNTAPEEVCCFATNCSACGAPVETRMQLVDVPHFREVVVMAASCDACGFRTSEVRSGGAVSAHGKRITLRVSSAEDLCRDVLKSATATLAIPEIDLSLTTGALGGRFTTLEGLLRQVASELAAKVPFATGDAARPETRGALARLLSDIERICDLSLPATLILDDPLAQSYVQSLCAPDPDDALTIECYERTHEQNEELGLNDICVEGYAEGE